MTTVVQRTVTTLGTVITEWNSHFGSYAIEFSPAGGFTRTIERNTNIMRADQTHARIVGKVIADMQTIGDCSILPAR